MPGKPFARSLTMVSPGHGSLDDWLPTANAEIVREANRADRLDEWLASFYPAQPVSLQLTSWENDHVAYLALFISP